MLPAKVATQQRKRLRFRLQDAENRLYNIANYRALAVRTVFEEIKASLSAPGTPVYEVGPSTGNYSLIGEFQGFLVSDMFEVYWTIMSPRGFGITHRAAFCTCEAVPAAP
ncbi:hypothetical protein FRC00_006101 [Tulasnella sp. 408]|nr:hypothetical protein FRC00_006101 [Tulasnella sp. 408]